MAKAFDDWARIQHFMVDGGMDAERRTLREYRAFTDEQMESAHDYIQWMFPTDQPSKFNPYAPLLLEADSFGNRGMVGPVMRSVLQFTGFLARRQRWRKPGDHNILRITRMLRSVKLICGDDAALDLFEIVCEFRSDAEDDLSVAYFSAGRGHYVMDHWIAALIDGDVVTGKAIREEALHFDNIHMSMTTTIRRHINQRKEAA